MLMPFYHHLRTYGQLAVFPLYYNQFGLYHSNICSNFTLLSLANDPVMRGDARFIYIYTSRL